MKVAQVCLWDEDFTRVDRIAADRGVPMSALIRRALDAWLESHDYDGLADVELRSRRRAA